MARSSELVTECAKMLLTVGVPAVRINCGAVKVDGRFIRMTSEVGVSDVIACVPPHGRFLAVECKTGRGKPTDSQIRFLDAISTAGGEAIVAHDDLDKVIAFLERSGVL